MASHSPEPRTGCGKSRVHPNGPRTLGWFLRVEAVNPTGNHGGLWGALDLDDLVNGDLVAALDLFNLGDLRLHTNLGAHRNRRGEADLVQSIVDARANAGDVKELGPEGDLQAQREVAVGDRPAKGTVLGLFRVGVDPLVVIRRVGKRVDLVLGDGAEVAVPKVGAGGGCELLVRKNCLAQDGYSV